MRLLLFGFAHHARMRAQAGDHDVRGVRRGAIRRFARFRMCLPLRAELREVGREAFPDLGERHAWAAAQAVWDRVARADAVAVWNGGRDVALAAVRAARMQGKPLVFVENGFLPGTCQVDTQGINYDSSLARLDRSDLLGLNLPNEADASVDLLTFRQRPLGRDDGSTAQVEALEGVPSGFVLFAAQVHDDSQIRRFSPDFPTVEAAIRYVAAECDAAGLPLVVKPHPSDHGRVDDAALRAELAGVRFLDRTDNAELVAACRAFVTVNSSMALQAVHAGKPVYTLGDAAYNLPGVATRVRPPTRLRDLLATPDVDASLRRKYLAFLHQTLVPHASRVPTDDQLRGLVARIVALARSGG